MTETTIPAGIYPPVPTFFDAAGEVDLATLQRHLRWLGEHDLPGVLALGSNGEMLHLDDAERVAVTRAAREAALGRTLLVGATDFATRGTIRRAQLVADAGADVAVILPPFAFPTQMSPAALRAHFLAVADASPIPILIYNMPANTANLDLSADLVIDLAEHPNIIGMKDSGGQVAKLARIVAATPDDFIVLAGSGSFLLPTLAVGGHGAIAAVANVIPTATAALFRGWQDCFSGATMAPAMERPARLQRLQRLQAALIPLNQAVTAGLGVAGLKAALEVARGYGGAPRLPLLPATAAQQTTLRDLYTACVAEVQRLLDA